MRILHVLDHSVPLHSGYTFRTLSILEEQRRRGWETLQLTSPKQGRTNATAEIVDGWLFHRTSPGDVDWPPLMREWALMRRLERRLMEVATEQRPDLIHAHSPVLNAVPALRVGRRLGIPVVYEVRAFWEDAAVDQGTTSEGSMRYRLTGWYETRALRRAHHVFTICEGLRSDIVGRGIEASKVTVIPNAVDVQSFVPGGGADPLLRTRLGLDGCTVLGFVGSFYPYEGLELLITALQWLAVAHPELRLMLVGGGPQDEALRSEAQRLGLADRVVFAGRVPHAEVQRYYDLIDVLAYPRRPMRLTELVTPLKPLEAMAQGRVILASDVGGHRELIRDGETGTLFAAGSVRALADAIDRVLAERAHWPTMRRAGRRFVECERNWPNSVARYAEPYRLAVAAAK